MSRAFLRMVGCLLVASLMMLPAIRPAAAQDMATHNRAVQALDDGRFGDALSTLERLIEANPNDAGAYLLRARAYEGRKAYQYALADYRRVLELTPGDPTAMAGVQRMVPLVGTNALDSLDNLKRLLDANPNSLQYRLQYADELYRLARYREAANQYERYLQRTQGPPDIVQRYLISIAGYEGDNERGVLAAEHYLERYPNEDDLYARLGFFRLWQNQRSGAQQAFEQALRLNPGNSEATHGLEQIRDPNAAARLSKYPIDVLTRELKLHPNDDARRFELVDLLAGAGRYHEAKYHLDVLAPRYRKEADWQSRYRNVVARLKAAPGPTSRIDRLTKNLKHNPGDDETRLKLIDALVQFKRYAEAFDHLAVIKDAKGRTLYDKIGASHRWRDLFARVDAGLGKRSLHRIDRYRLHLELHPTDRSTRYALTDALRESGRIAEAYEVLAAHQYFDTQDAAYRQRIQALTETRRQVVADSLTALQAQLSRYPNDLAARRALPAILFRAHQLHEATAAYEALLSQTPSDNVRREYSEMLLQTGAPRAALAQAAILIDHAPDNIEFQRAYALAALDADSIDATADRYLRSSRDDDDVPLILAKAAYDMKHGRLDEADGLIRQADAMGIPAYQTQIDAANLLYSREEERAKQVQARLKLNDARKLVAAKAFSSATTAYASYFETIGKRPRAILKEVALVHTAAGDYEAALGILQALQMQQNEDGIGKEIAKNQFYRKDFAAAAETLTHLIKRHPRDFEIRLLLSDSDRELGQFGTADKLLEQADSTAITSRLVRDRKRLIGAMAGPTGRPQDFAGLVVPTSGGVVASGGGTRFERWSQGIQSQITLPVPAVVTVGLTSHFLRGSERLIRNSPIVRGRINQIFAGAFVDFRPPPPSVKYGYISRLSGRIGLFDYDGGRTAPFGSIRYWHQVPNRFTFSLGGRVTEGSLALWSPAGGAMDLRLTQIDVRTGTASLLPDSFLKVSARVALNLVRAGADTTSAGRTNRGVSAQLDGGLRIFPFTHLGLTYAQIDYRTPTSLYFSPQNYETVDFWLEYEREVARRWYFRLRGSAGAVAHSGGFISKRIEGEWVSRLTRHLSLTLLGSFGQSTRSLSSRLTTLDRYSIASFTGALYWTL